MQELAQLYAMLANRRRAEAACGFAPTDPRSRRARAAQRRSQLHGDGHAAPACAPGRDDRRATGARCRSIGRPARRWAFRDAWTAGIFGPYVLVVWVGNFDGSGNPAFVGVDAAAPLFFQIVDAVRGRASGPARAGAASAARRLKRVEICLASGDLPNQLVPADAAHLVHSRQIADPRQHGASPGDDRRRDGPAGVSALCRQARASGNVRVLAVRSCSRCSRRPASRAASRRRIAACANAGALARRRAAASPRPCAAAPMCCGWRGRTRQPSPSAPSTDADMHALYWFVGRRFRRAQHTGRAAVTGSRQRPDDYRVRVVDDHGRSDERPLDVTLAE